MKPTYSAKLQWLVVSTLLAAIAATGSAQTAEPRALIRERIDESRLVRLAGNTRPEANHRNDLGRVPDDLPLDMFLQLKRSPEREVAAREFVESLTDTSSGNFHHWISATEYGRRFGAAPEDIATLTGWLRSHGFIVNGVTANNLTIDFSGDAGQVREALHTEIHHLAVDGKRLFANMSDPQIPAALAPAVEGVVSLHNFPPHPMLVPRSQYTIPSVAYPVVPGDLATIYNLNPAFAAGYTGLGQTIVLVEDTDLYNATGDWSVFRQTFGLNQYTHGSLAQVHPAPGTGGPACADPGINNDDIEAALDVEWASAAAPDATIVMASCAGTTNFGGFIALENLLSNGGPLPGVVSISYGEMETVSGATLNSYIATLYQTAAAAGVSVFVAAGDGGAAGFVTMAAVFGINVSGWASTPYNVAVGGTDFGDTAAGTEGNFWNVTNGQYYNSALSYVPEIPWNDSCASSVAARHDRYATGYGPGGLCAASPFLASTIGGSGGPSACATGAPNIDFAVSGTCAGYEKPAWQNVFGNPNDGIRDLPDVSLFASNGFWGHYYVLCFSAMASCASAPSEWVGIGGTSASAPIMAGIQALINQALATNNSGNPNPVYYHIAQDEYASAAGTAACNSSTGPASTCSFNDVTEGDNVSTCAGAFSCYLDGEALGALSTSNTSYEPAYAATPGWDFATGLGSVNAYNLLKAFVASMTPTSSPDAPALLSPANGATGVGPVETLTWNASWGATSYDVYFGTTSPPPLVARAPGTNYVTGTLTAATTYYWAIGARNQLGANASAAWSFSTGCVTALNPSGASIGSGGGTGTIPVIATAGCAWTAASNAAWINITSGAAGSGNGTVGYTVAANPGPQRTGTITVAGQTFTVTEWGIYPVISTLAGGGVPLAAVPGTSVAIPVSWGVAVDSAGNVYFSSTALNAVFKLDTVGVVMWLAGNGAPGSSGDGGPALTAQLSQPAGVAVDKSGNVYIADNGNSRIRKVDTSGTITTLAGNGTPGYMGDGGPASDAEMGPADGLAADASGNIYIPDTSHNIIRKVNAAGIITTVAGNGTSGFSGDGGAATRAELAGPNAVAVDGAGNLYIADTSNMRIRKVNPAGIITTVAGSGSCCNEGDGGPATSAQLQFPSSVAVDGAGNFYIADSGYNRIRKVNSAGIITTIAGNGSPGYTGDGGSATQAELANPGGVAADGSGNLYFADTVSLRLRKVSAAGIITTVAGGGTGDSGLAVFGLLSAPWGIARDSAGNTYIADTGNNRVRKVAASGVITTVAGVGTTGYSGDGGPGISAQLNAPEGLALDASGNLYIADTYNFRVRRLDTSGNMTTVAGNGSYGYTGDGDPAVNAQFGAPWGLAVDSSGNLYISDAGYGVVRKVNASGIISTVAGSGAYGFSGDGGPATAAAMRNPHGVAVDGAGNLYIADMNNNRVRKVGQSGTITTVAGNGNCCNGGDGGPATSANLGPQGIALDGAGNLYIANTGGNSVRVVNGAGIITTIAGSGSSGYSGDGSVAIAAEFNAPCAIALGAAGAMAVTDQGNNAVRMLTPDGTTPVLTIESAHDTFTAGQSGTYTLMLRNAGAAGPTRGTVTVREILPAAVSLVSMAGTGWTCAAPAQPVCTRSDALSGGSSYAPITVTVNVSASAPDQFSNQATVTGGGSSAAGTQDFTIVTPAVAAGSVSRRLLVAGGYQEDLLRIRRFRPVASLLHARGSRRATPLARLRLNTFRSS